MMLTRCLTDSCHTCGSFLDPFLAYLKLLLLGNACYFIFSCDFIVIHCINLEYTVRYHLLKSTLDKFFHHQSLWVNGTWYVSYKTLIICSFLHSNIVALILIIFMLQISYAKSHYMCYLLLMPLRNHVWVL